MKKLLLFIMLLFSRLVCADAPLQPANTVMGCGSSPCAPSGVTAAQVSNVGAGSNTTPTTLTKTTGGIDPLNQFGFFSNVNLTGASDTIPYGYANVLLVTDSLDSTAQTGNAGVAGALDIQHTLTTGSKGGKITARFYLTANAAGPDAGSVDRNYVDLATVVSTYNMGGSSSGPTYEGLWYGYNCALTVPATGSTYVDTITCQENDITNSSTTTSIRQGVSIINVGSTAGTNPTYAGVNGDYAILIAGSNNNTTAGHVGWSCGICFGGFGGYFDVATTGTIFSDWANNNASGEGLNVSTVGSIMDFHDLTVTNYDMNLPNFSVTGTGVVATPAGTLIGASGQSAIPFITAGSSYMDATGNLVIGQAPGNSATVTFSGGTYTPGTTGITATCSGVCFTGTAAGDTGRVITVYTGSVYLNCIVTGNSGSSTTIVQCTAPTTNSTSLSSSAYTNANSWISGTYSATNTAYSGGTAYTAPLPYASGNQPTAAYFYLPATAPPGVAGWYYCTVAFLANAVCYNNTYSSGNPTVPVSPTAFSGLTPGTFTQAVTNLTGPSYTIPAGALGLNGAFDIQADYAFDTSGNTKGATSVFGGSATPYSASPSAITGIIFNAHCGNAGSASVQYCYYSQLNSALAWAQNSVAPYAPNAINTANAQTLVLKQQLGAATDTMALLWYSITVKPN